MKASTIEHISGWAFFLVAVGLFGLVPGAVLFGVTLDGAQGSESKVAGIMLFAVSLVTFLTGLILLIFWCKAPAPDKDDEEKMMEKKNNNTPRQDKYTSDARTEGSRTPGSPTEMDMSMKQ